MNDVCCTLGYSRKELSLCVCGQICLQLRKPRPYNVWLHAGRQRWFIIISIHNSICFYWHGSGETRTICVMQAIIQQVNLSTLPVPLTYLVLKSHYWGLLGLDLCHVAAVLSYMVARGNAQCPLFIWEDGRYFTRDCIVARVRLALSKAGYVAKDHAGHSCCIGVTTTAARCGIQVSLIKTLRR